MNRDNHDNDSQAREGSAPERTRGARKPYQRPEILYRQPLEASAVVCTIPGAKGSPGACPSGPITS